MRFTCKLVVGLMVFAIKSALALPQVVIPSLSYAPGVTPPLSNMDVRGALINSGKFSVIEAPESFNLARVLNPQSTPPKITASAVPESGLPESAVSESSLASQPSLLQDGVSYLLVGKVIAADDNSNVYIIPNTDKQTINRNLAYTVSYRLIRIKDKKLLAAFTAYGSATQVRLAPQGTSLASVHFDQPLLVRDASRDLANNVLSQLLDQYNSTLTNEQNEQRVVTDVKTYSD